MMKTINVEIEGKTPLLMARFSIEQYLESKKSSIRKKEQNFEEEAKQSAHFSRENETKM